MLNIKKKQAQDTDSVNSIEKQDLGEDISKALNYHDQPIEYTPEEERKVLWKIDLRLMPMLAITYGIQFVDKVTLGYAANYGLQEDTNLQGQDYSLLSAAFYISYLVFEFPLVSIMQKFPLAKFLGVNIIIWGGIVMSHAAANNFAGLLVCRLLLGVFEATISPGSSMLTGRFYKKSEMSFRISCWISFNGLGQFIGGLLAFGIGHIHGSLSSWKYIFLVLGAITSAWGFVVLFFLQSSPTTANFFNERERKIAVARVTENKTGVSENKKIKLYQIKEAFTDPQIILIFLISVGMNMPNGGVTNFLTLIIQGIGFDALGTVLHQLPGGACQFVFMIVGGIMLGKIPNGQIFVSIFWMLPNIACSICLWKLPRENSTGLLVSTYFLSTFVITMIMILSMLNTNISGTTKKSTAHAIYFVGYCAGNIGGPFLFKSEEAPTYDSGSLMMIICFSSCTVLLLCLRFYYTYENRRKRRALEEQGMSDPDVYKIEAEQLGLLDKTDQENPYFFYTV